MSDVAGKEEQTTRTVRKKGKAAKKPSEEREFKSEEKGKRKRTRLFAGFRGNCLCRGKERVTERKTTTESRNQSDQRGIQKERKKKLSSVGGGRLSWVKH